MGGMGASITFLLGGNADEMFLCFSLFFGYGLG